MAHLDSIRKDMVILEKSEFASLRSENTVRRASSHLVCLYIRCHVLILCCSLCRKWSASWSNSKTDCRWEKTKSAHMLVRSGQTITTCVLLFYRRRVWRSEQKPSWTSTWRAAGSLTWCVLPGSLTRWRICFLLLLWSQKYSQIYSVLKSWLSSHTFVWVIKVATMLVMLLTAHSRPLWWRQTDGNSLATWCLWYLVFCLSVHRAGEEADGGHVWVSSEGKWTQ